MENIARIEKIFRMLGSTHDGEILNAVNSIRKILIAQDKNFSDLANKLFNGEDDAGHGRSGYRSRSYNRKYDEDFKREYQRQQEYKEETIEEFRKMAEYLINMPQMMTNWESTFISDVYNRQLLEGHQLSGKQESCLYKIYKTYYKDEKKK